MTQSAKERIAAARKAQETEKQQKRDDPGPGEAERAAYINEVRFSGTLMRDTELAFTGTGKAIAKNRVAVWQPPRNNDKPISMFFDLDAWEPNDKSPDMYEEVFNEFCDMKKGAKVVVRGRLNMREWEKDGVKHQAYSITLADIG